MTSRRTNDPKSSISGDAKAGMFLARLGMAAAWFLAVWLVLFRTASFEISPVLRTMIAVIAGAMGLLTIIWAVFGRARQNTKGSSDQ